VHLQLANTINALEYLHNKNIIHRDISPDNLIISSNGKLYLIDFGTAKYFREFRTPVEGFPSSEVFKFYFSPGEQFEGRIYFQSDIFSVGRTMFYMLTGELPPRSPFDELRFPRGIREDLANIAIKAAKEKVEDRYSSVGEMRSELESLIRPPIITPLPSIGPRLIIGSKVYPLKD